MATTSKLKRNEMRGDRSQAKSLQRAGRLLVEAASRRVALALMALFLAALALQALLPQRGLTPPAQYAHWQAQNPLLAQVAQALGLNQVSATPWFWALGLALAASLALCTARQAWELARGGALLHRGEGRREESTLAMAGPDLSSEELAKALRRQGYRVAEGDRGLRAHKGSLGPWGSVAFHGGMVALCAGALLSAATWFTGFVELAPGQVFLESRGYLAQKSGAFARQDARLTAEVRDMGVAFWPDDSLKDIWVTVAAQEGSGPPVEGTVRRNEALGVGESTLTLGSPFGPAALLSFKPASGGATEARQGYVHFLAESPRTNFTIPGAGLDVEAELTGPWRAALEGKEFAAPLALRLTAPDGERGLKQMEIALGQAAPLAGGELQFVTVKPWALFMVGRDRGIPVMLLGGALAVLGLGLALFIAPRWVRAQPEAGGWWLAGQAPWGTASLRRELEALAAEQEAAVDA